MFRRFSAFYYSGKEGGIVDGLSAVKNRKNKIAEN